MSSVGAGFQVERTVGQLGRQPSTWWLVAGVTCFLPVIGPIIAIVVLLLVVVVDLFRNRVGRSRSWVWRARLVGVGVPILYAVVFGALVHVGFGSYVDGNWREDSGARMAELEQRKAAVSADVPVDEALKERWRIEEDEIKRDAHDELIARGSTVVSVSALLALFASFGVFLLLRKWFLAEAQDE